MLEKNMTPFQSYVRESIDFVLWTKGDKCQARWWFCYQNDKYEKCRRESSGWNKKCD